MVGKQKIYPHAMLKQPDKLIVELPKHGVEGERAV